mgnify:CR=1 FL=1
MRPFIIAAALILTACAQTPADVRQTGAAFTARSANAPAALITCMTRNAEANSMQTTTRPGTTAGDTEFLAYVTPDGLMNVIFTGELTPAGTGTMAAIRINRNALSPERMRDAMMNGC